MARTRRATGGIFPIRPGKPSSALWRLHTTPRAGENQLRKIITVTAVAAAGLAGLGGAAYASGTDDCKIVRDHITKTDNGHGTPPEWADLSLHRATKVCQTDGAYDV